MMGIYQIQNTENNKKYVGKSSNIEARWKQHLKELSENKHVNRLLQKDYDIYGKEVFDFEVLEIVKDKNDLLLKEKQYINALEDGSSYNLSDKFVGNKIYTNMGPKPKTEEQIRIQSLVKKLLKEIKYPFKK